MGQRFYGCVRCRVRRQRVGSRMCGPCSRGAPLPRVHDDPTKRRHIRGSCHHGNLMGPPPSPRGQHGDKCPVCHQPLSFGTLDGVAVEWCPTHGMTVTPKDRRYPRVHDQHEALVAALAREVANEMRPIQRQPDRRNMPPLDFRVWA